MKIPRCLSDRKILMIVLLISFTLSGLVSVTAIEGNPLNIGKNSMYADGLLNTENNSTDASNPVTVKVLIYDGDGVIPGSVSGVEDS